MGTVLNNNGCLYKAHFKESGALSFRGQFKFFCFACLRFIVSTMVSFFLKSLSKVIDGKEIVAHDIVTCNHIKD